MKLQTAITMQVHTPKWFGVNYGEIIFTNYQDFKEVLRFLWDIKRSLYETDYQWKFDVFYIKSDLLVRIEDKKGVQRNSGIEQCLDWLRHNGVEVNVHNPNVNEKTPILAPPITPSVSSM